MTHFENNILENFFNGSSDETERKNISENLTNPNHRKEKKMKQNSKKFDADLAWKKMYHKINKDENLLTFDYNNKRKQLFNSLKIAATILLFSGLSLFAYYNFTADSTVKITSENNLKTVSLPDGSLITLNSNSEISYPKQFAQKNRKVKFKGEAFFNISKNPERPFIIETKNADIKVLGTSFNVNTENKKTEVIVKTGKVEMKSSDNKVVLTPGEKGLSNAGKLQKNQNTDPNYLAWKTHFFTYENTSLSKIVADVNKIYKVNIILDSPEIKTKVMGKATFNNDSIDTIIRIICKNFNLNSKKEGNNIILYD